jgi:hypothetical protein
MAKFIQAMHMKVPFRGQLIYASQVRTPSKVAKCHANKSWSEGDDTAYGQALYPVPAEDPNDPLQVDQWN